MQAEQATEQLKNVEAAISGEPGDKEAALFAAGWLEANIRNRLDVIPIKTRKHLEVAIALLKRHGELEKDS